MNLFQLKLKEEEYIEKEVAMNTSLKDTLDEINNN